jgi:hypothetical protein
MLMRSSTPTVLSIIIVNFLFILYDILSILSSLYDIDVVNSVTNVCLFFIVFSIGSPPLKKLIRYVKGEIISEVIIDDPPTVELDIPIYSLRPQIAYDATHASGPTKGQPWMVEAFQRCPRLNMFMPSSTSIVLSIFMLSILFMLSIWYDIDVVNSVTNVCLLFFVFSFGSPPPEETIWYVKDTIIREVIIDRRPANRRVGHTYMLVEPTDCK